MNASKWAPSSAFALVLALGGCSGDDEDGNMDSTTAADTSTGSDGSSTSSVVPSDSTLNAYLQAESYKTNLVPEPAPHASAGPHGSSVRTWFTAELATSLRDGNTSHPVGSAVVKELFDGENIDGWAVGVKVSNDGNAQDWYWYEVLSTDPGATPVADSRGAGLCAGCHSSGRDYVRTEDPIPAP